MGIFGSIIAGVAVSAAQSYFAPKEKTAAGAQSKGLLAPPSEPFQSGAAAKYGPGKFDPETNFSKSEKGAVAGATPALKSVDPVNTEVMYWQQLFRNAVRDSRMKRDEANG